MASESQKGTSEPIRSRSSLKERQLELRENVILDVANEFLMTKGYALTTLDEVIAEVGISKPTFYQHFRSKEDLFAGVLVRGMQEATAHLKHLERSLPPTQALRAMIDWTFNKRFDSKSGCFYDLQGVLSLLSVESVRVTHQELIGEFASIFERGQKMGAARPGIPPVLLAQVALSIFKDWGYEEMITSGQLDLSTIKKGIGQLLLGEDDPEG